MTTKIPSDFCLCSDLPPDTMKFSHESRLVSYLQRRYERAGTVARPVMNSSQKLDVEFALALIQILDFDETNQVLTTNVWKRYVRDILDTLFSTIIN